MMDALVHARVYYIAFAEYTYAYVRHFQKYDRVE